jgi:hypothetical protein
MKRTIRSIILSALTLTLIMSQIGFSAYIGDITELTFFPMCEATYIIGPYNSTHYYAQNGTTGAHDCLSTNATKTMNDHVESNSKMFIKTGRYPISKLLIAGVENFTIECEPEVIFEVNDEGATDFLREFEAFKVNPSGSIKMNCSPIILVDNSKNIKVEGLTIEDTGTDRLYERAGFMVWNSTDVHLDHCKAFNISGSAFITRSNGTCDFSDPSKSNLYTRNVLIENCIANITQTSYLGPMDTKGFGFEIEWSQDVIVRNCKAIDMDESAFASRKSRFVRFRDNEIQNIARAEGEGGGEPFDIGKGSDNIIISGNTINCSYRMPGIYIYSYVRDVTVENNYISTNISNYADPFPQIRLSQTDSYNNPIQRIYIRNNYLTGGIVLKHGYLEDIYIVNNKIGQEVRYVQPDTPSLQRNIVADGNTFLNRTANTNFEIIGNNTCIATMTIRNNHCTNKIWAENTSKLIIDHNEWECDGVTASYALKLNGFNGEIDFSSNRVFNTTNEVIRPLATCQYTQNNTILRVLDNNIIECGHNGGVMYPLRFEDNSFAKVIVRGNIFNGTVTSKCVSIGNNPATIEFNDVDKTITATNAVVRFNNGYVTENSGTQTVANNENIAHGLVTTPVYYNVVCLNETYDGEPVSVWLDYSGITSTNLNVCVYWLNGTAITDDIILVAWEARMWT